MVLRKCSKDGESRIDWVKSLAVIGVFSGVIMWGINLAKEADRKAETALVKMESLEKRTDRMESKIDRLLERK